MKEVEPEWSWIAVCPNCCEPVDQFDDNVEEDYYGDDCLVSCECKEKFIVKLN